jgi:hypothetical protein
MKMMITSENENGLKDQYNLAQGKRSVALGSEMGIKIVRAITFLEVLSLFRTKSHESQFHLRQADVRKEFFDLIIVFARTFFYSFFLPRALPGARIDWPFRLELVHKRREGLL